MIRSDPLVVLEVLQVSRDDFRSTGCIRCVEMSNDDFKFIPVDSGTKLLEFQMKGVIR